MMAKKSFCLLLFFEMFPLHGESNLAEEVKLLRTGQLVNAEMLWNEELSLKKMRCWRCLPPASYHHIFFTNTVGMVYLFASQKEKQYNWKKCKYEVMVSLNALPGGGVFVACKIFINMI